MGLYDRDYARDRKRFAAGHTGRGGDFRARVAALSFNNWMLGSNIVIFIVMAMWPLVGNSLFAWGHFSTARGFFGLEVWRFLTFQFLHANLIHLLFNMFALWVFGGMVEQRLGFKRYAAFYLVCGIFGAIMYLTLNMFGWAVHATTGNQLPFLLFYSPTTPLIGASAGVFGVVMAAAYYQPHAVMQLIFPPISVRLRTLAYVYVGFALFNLLVGGSNAGGDAAHVGGAIAGAYFVRHPHLLHDFFDVFKPPAKKGRRRAGMGRQPLARGARDAPDPKEVDRLLGKVATQGLGSLTDAERETLRNASESQRR